VRLTICVAGLLLEPVDLPAVPVCVWGGKFCSASFWGHHSNLRSVTLPATPVRVGKACPALVHLHALNRFKGADLQAAHLGVGRYSSLRIGSF